MTPTSGELRYTEAKGLHFLDRDWWIDLSKWKLPDFLLVSYDGHDGSELKSGRLTCRKGYLWDGSSGPTIDGKADPAPSLVHDTIYEAFRTGQLGSEWRGVADDIYYALLRERGMSKRRAIARWVGLRLIGWWNARKSKGPQYPKRVAA